MARNVREVRFAAGETASDPVFIAGTGFNGVVVPAGFEGTTLTFQRAVGDRGTVPPGGDFRTMADTTKTALTVPVDATLHITVAPDVLHGIGWFRLLASAPQTQERVVQLVNQAGELAR